jgi:hypothetical protein
VSGGDKVRSFGGFLSRLGGGPRPADSDSPGTSPPRRHANDGSVVPTKALRKFLSYLGSHDAPVLLDCGPVVGSNVTFFGEQLNCKVYIEDLFADLDRHLRAGTVDAFPAFLAKRLRLGERSVDGVLLWDLFDYLDRASAQALATALVRLIRVDGALLGFFSTTASPESGFTKFVVVNEAQVRHRPYPSVATRQRSLQSRDIIKMFTGLSVSDSFLLHNTQREILFRKPRAGAGGRPTI